MEKYKVTLTVEERQALDRMVSSARPRHESWSMHGSCFWAMKGRAGPAALMRRSSRL